MLRQTVTNRRPDALRGLGVIALTALAVIAGSAFFTRLGPTLGSAASMGFLLYGAAIAWFLLNWYVMGFVYTANDDCLRVCRFYGKRERFMADVWLNQLLASGAEEEMKRPAAMARDYPLIVGKLLLMIRAGMSVRAALEKIAADYRRSLAGGSGRREGCELIVSIVNAMGNGLPENAAYSRLAENAPVREYRTMGLLLSRGIRKGNDETVRLLELSEAEASEERRKAARILGEEAETKMIFPMLLLMGVVFALLMVPAWAAFG